MLEEIAARSGVELTGPWPVGASAFASHGDGLPAKTLEACEEAAKSEGFRKLALGATLSGLPLYLAYGFEPIEEFDVTMPDGVVLRCVAMEKPIA